MPKPTLTLARRKLRKRFPLAISRGTSTGSENVFVSVARGDHVGLGECAPGVGEDEDSLAGRAVLDLERFWDAQTDDGLTQGGVRALHARACLEGMDPPTLAGLDMALWDLLAKEAGMPLYRLLGYDLPSVPTSITIGLNPPEVTSERVPKLLETGCKALKIKLGSPEGLEFDRIHFEAARAAAAPYGATLRVDANGGWSLDDAKKMMPWLKERGVDYVEQPLASQDDGSLPELFRDRCLPIFADESCRFAQDVPRLAGMVDGVNLKLMKCGGITGALAIIETARAHGLALMIGCMGESSISISAGAALGGAMTHIDLDSHLNLAPDPARGAVLLEGIVLPPERPGHGGEFTDA